MPSMLNQCGECVELVFDECTDIVIAPTSGLNPNTVYWWFLEDSQGNIYKHSVTSDADGNLSISPDHLPEGFLTAGIGQVTITIRDDENSLVDIPLTYNSTAYDCIIASFANSTVITGYYE